MPYFSNGVDVIQEICPPPQTILSASQCGWGSNVGGADIGCVSFVLEVL